MCLAVPARITSIEGTQAEIDAGGVRRTVSLMLTPAAKVGDYVLLHTGYAINIIDEEEAKLTISLLEQLVAENEE